ncbi:MAG TPA: hypothetical protein VFT99_13930 [Roseiflexaceae bacterium]|nr:hypothetical protein [Roseiflexaceae bacterium]
MSGYTGAMMHTEYDAASPLVVQRLRGQITRAQIAQGSLHALDLIGLAAATHGFIVLLLDLRELHFADLQAHRAWRMDFLGHPALRRHTRRVAVVGSDSPSFRAEWELLQSPVCRFFFAVQPACAWLLEQSLPGDAVV